MIYIIGIVIGYLIGSISMAYIISKSKGIDIKKTGTNNAGASNVFAFVGKAEGVAVGAFDILKAFLTAEFVYLISGGNFNAGAIAGVAAVVGHIFPFWMNFNGGKGFAPFLGTVLFVDWKLFLVFAVTIAVITLVTNYIVLATFSLTAAMPLYEFFIDKNYILAAVFFALAVLIWYRHKKNIVNLANGTEIKFKDVDKCKK